MEHFTDALFENLSEGLFDKYKKMDKAQLQQLLLERPVLVYYDHLQHAYKKIAYYAVFRPGQTKKEVPYYAVGTKSTTGLDIEQIFTDQDNRGIDRLWNYIVTTILDDPEEIVGAYDYQDPRLKELKLLKVDKDIF